MKRIAILYTDGSALNNPNGPFGYGAHGFIYDDDVPKGKTTGKPNSYLITNKGYIDQAEVNMHTFENVNPIEYLDWYGSCGDIGSNNQAEVLAAVNSIEKLLEMDIKKLIIKTDSMYLIHIVNAIKAEFKWRNSDKPNLNLWGEIERALELLKKHEIEFEIVKVKGHSNSLGNNTADRLALLGRIESSKKMGITNNFNVYSTKGYWKPSNERHPFLFYKQLFFTTTEPKEADGGVIYSILDYKEEQEIGKKLHTASYGIVYIKEPITIIEQVKDAYKRFLNNHSVVSTIRLDRVYSPNIFNYINKFGDNVLTKSNKGRRAISVLEDEVVCAEIHPPGLAFKALENTNILRSILGEYRKWKSTGERPTVKDFIDVTDSFYNIDEKGNTLIKPEIDGQTISIEHMYQHEGNDFKIQLQLGRDIIARNQIKKIEKLKPLVYIIVLRHSPTKIEYFTLIDTQTTGDIVVLCNYYSNNVYLTKQIKK